MTNLFSGHLAKTRLSLLLQVLGGGGKVPAPTRHTTDVDICRDCATNFSTNNVMIVAAS